MYGIIGYVGAKRAAPCCYRVETTGISQLRFDWHRVSRAGRQRTQSGRQAQPTGTGASRVRWQNRYWAHAVGNSRRAIDVNAHPHLSADGTIAVVPALSRTAPPFARGLRARVSSLLPTQIPKPWRT